MSLFSGAMIMRRSSSKVSETPRDTIDGSSDWDCLGLDLGEWEKMCLNLCLRQQTGPTWLAGRQG
jgi:hypothetical protein